MGSCDNYKRPSFIGICAPTDCECLYCGAGQAAVDKCNAQVKANPHGVSVGVNTSAIPGYDQIKPLIDAFNTLTSPDTWVRVGVFMFALVFVIVGFMIISSGGSNK